MFFAAVGQNLVNDNSLPHTAASKENITHILNLIFVTTGGLALLMIVIAGFSYILAAGEPTKVSKAKNMILYSVIGLILSALAYTIVNFVLKQFK